MDLIVEKGRTGRRPEFWEGGEGFPYSFYKMFSKLFTIARKQVNFSYGLEDATTAVGKPRK